MKTGWKTTEFWLSLIAVAAGGAYGCLAEGAWKDAVGVIVSVLAALGYTASRTLVKVKEIENDEEEPPHTPL